MKNPVIAVIATAMIWTSPIYSQPTPQYFAGTGHWYQTVELSSFTWLQARDAAVAAGGYLACIGSQSENDFIQGILPAVLSANLGGYEDNWVEGQWQWVNGDSWGNYLNWSPGEPNNGLSFPPEDILLMHGPNAQGFPLGKWNDGKHTDVQTNSCYVIEFNTDPSSFCAGNALQFDGGDDEATIKYDASLVFALGQPMTVECWFKADQAPPQGNAIHILGRTGCYSWLNYQVAIIPGYLLFYGPSSKNISAPFTLELGRWYHVAAIDDGSTVSLYLDGVQKSGTIYTYNVQNDSADLKIGASGGCPKFPGQIDEVRLWNVARTPEQINANMNQSVPCNSAGLAGYWNFDEAVGSQQVLDCSSAGNNGTLGANSSIGSDDPVRVVSTAPICSSGSQQLIQAISDLRAAQIGYVTSLICGASRATGRSYYTLINVANEDLKKVEFSDIWNFTQLPLNQAIPKLVTSLEGVGAAALHLEAKAVGLWTSRKLAEAYGLLPHAASHFDLNATMTESQMISEMHSKLENLVSIPGYGSLSSLLQAIDTEAEEAILSVPSSVPLDYELVKVLDNLSKYKRRLLAATLQGCTGDVIENTVYWVHPQVPSLSDSNRVVLGSTGKLVAQTESSLTSFSRNTSIHQTVFVTCSAISVAGTVAKIFGVSTAGIAEILYGLADVGCALAEYGTSSVTLRQGIQLNLDIIALIGNWGEDARLSQKTYKKAMDDMVTSFVNPSSTAYAGKVVLLGASATNVCIDENDQDSRNSFLTIDLRNEHPTELSLTSCEVNLFTVKGTARALVGVPHNSIATVQPGEAKSIAFELPLVASSSIFAERYEAQVQVYTSSFSFAKIVPIYAKQYPCLDIQTLIPPAFAGVIHDGETTQKVHIPALSTRKVEFSLRYEGSDMDLHLYDQSGNHVGIDSVTGQMELEIPGAVHSGDSTNPEVIIISDLNSSTLEIVVHAESVPDSEYFSVDILEIGDHPARLEVSPPYLYLSGIVGDSLHCGILLSEVGCQYGLTGITCGITDLVDSTLNPVIQGIDIALTSGSELPACSTSSCAIDFMITQSVNPGQYVGTISIGHPGDSIHIPVMLTVIRPPLCGDADASGIITISDAVYLINYIFAGGPAPTPTLSGDADCNGIVTISDAVYLINYIFAGGPAPCVACP